MGPFLRSSAALLLASLAGLGCSSADQTGAGGAGGMTGSTSTTGTVSQAVCVIDGQQVPPGVADPANPCNICQPSATTTAYTPASDGKGCAPGKICSSGICFAGCYVDGETQAAGSANPMDVCGVCEPDQSTTDYSPIADGTSCGAGKVCSSGACQTACFIDGMTVAEGTPDPSDPCRICRPKVSVDAYSDADDGAACGAGKVCTAHACSAGCYIGGAFAAAGAADPNNPCRACDPAASTSAYSAVAGGTPCGTGKVCQAGTCKDACFISGAVRAADSANPNNPCQTCQPGVSTTAWTALADGSACGSGKICAGGTCQGECFVNGTLYSSGAVDPANPCHLCLPGTTTTAWSSAADGTACGPGQVCGAGQCQASCFINGAVVAAGAADPNNLCQTCQPAISTTAYTPSTSGTACAAGKVCSNGVCAAGCYINGAFVMSGSFNPANPCQGCDPSVSVTEWSPRAASELKTCAFQMICHGGACVSGCAFNSTFYAPGDSDASHVCYVCDPFNTTFSLTSLPGGTACGPGKICNGAGICFAACYIGGTVYASGAPNPANPCLTCQPAVSTSAFTAATDGTACSTGGGNVCIAGACSAGCVIGGVTYAANAVSPTDSCKGCIPTASKVTWSTFSDGWSCSSGHVCASGVCSADCYINGKLYPAGPNPVTSGAGYCQACDPANSTSQWSPYHAGQTCGTGFLTKCNGTNCCANAGTWCTGGIYTSCCSGKCMGSGGLCTTDVCTGTCQ